MHRVSPRVGLLILLIAAVVPALPAAQDQKADAKAKEKAKTKPDWSAEFIGKLTEINDSEEKGLIFTVQVNYKYPELNPDAQRQILQQQQTLAQQQLQLARAKSPQDRQNALNQMANTQRQLDQSAAQLYKLKDVNFDVKCKAADKFRVRKFEPVQPLDPETGEFVKMTKDLVAEAKGTEGYPGYKADSKILKTGQYIKVYVWKDTKTPANFLDKSKLATMKPEEVQAEVKNFRYDVIMVYVGTDPPPAPDKN
jgi:hypothetical protein